MSAPALSLPAGVERRRLAAARALDARPVGPGQYRVTGGAAPHYVDLAADGAALPKCDCPDALYRPAFVCKHRLAASLAAGDVTVIHALAALLAADAAPRSADDEAPAPALEREPTDDEWAEVNGDEYDARGRDE